MIVQRNPSTAAPPAHRLSWVAGVLWLLGVAAGARAADLTAVLTPDTVRVGERAALSVNFINCQPTVPPKLPTVPGLSFAFMGRSTSVNIVNTEQTTTVTLKYAITPDRPGDFDIPPVTAEVNGQQVASPRLKLKVLRPDENAPTSPGQNQLAFLRLTTAKDEVYLGEIVPVDVQVFYVNAQDIQLQPLTGDGFTFGKSSMLPPGQTQVGNQLYAMGGLRTTAVASKVGDLKLGPAECRLNLRIRSERRRSADPFFDSFFDDAFGGRFELRPSRLVSPPKTLRVLPLPTNGVPSDFTGAVGQYSLAVSVSPTNVGVGEPITVTVRVAGQGLFDNVRLPSLEHWDQFKVYPPTSEVETTDALGVDGTKTIQQVVVPETLETSAVPAVTFSYFDPGAKSYRTLRQPPTPLVVRPSSPQARLAPLAPPAVAPDQTPPTAADLVPLKVRGGPWAVISPPLVQQPWFLLLQGVPVAAFLSAWLWRRRKETLANNPRLVRRRAVARQVREGLLELRRLADENDSPAFHALTFRLLQEQIGERLNQPAASITESVVDGPLRERGLDRESLASLHGLFQACNQARYAPTWSRADLVALQESLEQALGALQQLKD